MHGRFTYMWLQFIVNVGQYSIHGCYGYDNLSVSVLGGLKTPGHREHPEVTGRPGRCRSCGSISETCQEKHSLSHRMHGMAYLPTLSYI